MARCPSKNEFNGSRERRSYLSHIGTIDVVRWADLYDQFPLLIGVTVMKRTIAILAAAALATSLLTAAADARGGGGGGGHGGGFGGGGHMGGFAGGAHMSGIGAGHIGGFGAGPHIGSIGTGALGGLGGGVHVGSIAGGAMEHSGSDHIGIGGRTAGLPHHATHRFRGDRYGNGLDYGYDLDCYDLYHRHPNHIWPPSCS
jgi:hypothetical protein